MAFSLVVTCSVAWVVPGASGPVGCPLLSTGGVVSAAGGATAVFMSAAISAWLRARP